MQWNPQQSSAGNPSYLPQTSNLSCHSEPEIDVERQKYLAERLALASNSEGVPYPFKDVKLTRADVEWLLVIQQDKHNTSTGLDLRGADLRQVNLCNLELRRMLGGRNWALKRSSTEEERDSALVHLEGADLGNAHLEEAFLGGAHLEEAFLGGAHLEEAFLQRLHLEGANLEEAHLERADLSRVHLEGANLTEAHLEGANLTEAHLEGANLTGAHLEGANLSMAFLGGKPAHTDYLKRVRHWDKDTLLPANLQEAFFDSSTILKEASLGEEKYGFVSLADVHWGDVNLSTVDWASVTMLGDERRARQTSWLYNYQAAVRAYRKLSSELRKQGLYEEASYFTYRSQLLQRRVLWRQMLQLRHQGRKGRWRIAQKMLDYLLSWFLDLFAGYGYKPARVLITYLLVIGIFMVIYSVLGSANGPDLSWGDLLIVSITAFHGRVFLPNHFDLSSSQTFTAAIEAVVGLFMEVSVILILARRFFRK